MVLETTDSHGALLPMRTPAHAHDVSVIVATAPTGFDVADLSRPLADVLSTVLAAVAAYRTGTRPHPVLVGRIAPRVEAFLLLPSNWLRSCGHQSSPNQLWAKTLCNTWTCPNSQRSTTTVNAAIM